MENPIIQELSAMAGWNLNPRQTEYYKTMSADAKGVKCVSVHEVFTNSEVFDILAIIKPRKGQCYRNAALLTELFPDRCRYVEGFGWNGFFKVEHAFNCVDGKYVDITWELALNEDVTKLPYVALIDAELDEILKDISDHGNITGDYYIHKYLLAHPFQQVSEGASQPVMEG